jgi:hypothetical protein
VTVEIEVSSCGTQGLLLAWDFNQPEAEIAFKMGLAADPNASMLHWGVQQVIGPGANR